MRSLTDLTPSVGVAASTMTLYPICATPANSLSGSEGGSGCSAALSPKFIHSNVWPSGAAFATVPDASVPPPAGRLSTTSGCPQLSVSFWPTMRARVSGWPPAPNPTMSRIGLLGNLLLCLRPNPP